MQFFPIKKSAHGGIFLVLTIFSNFYSIFSNNNTSLKAENLININFPESQNFDAI